MGENKELICESCSTTENTKYCNEYGGILCCTCHFNLVGEKELHRDAVIDNQYERSRDAGI